MQTTALSSRPSLARASCGRISRPRAVRVNLSVVKAASKHQEIQQAQTPGVSSTTVALASLLLQPQLAAWADDAALEAVASSASEVQAAAAGAAETSVPAPAWLGYVVLLSPILLYGIFNLYRSQVNPRAKFTDFLFIVAGVAVVANLFSILVLKIRLF